MEQLHRHHICSDKQEQLFFCRRVIHTLWSWKGTAAPKIPKGKWQEIGAGLKEGVKARRIMDDVRESVHHEFHQHHLADRRGLLLRLKQVQPHNNDQQRVLARVEEWRQLGEDDPVLFVKLQGEQASDGYDDSCPKSSSRHYLKQFGQRGFCWDCTHGTNAYDFTLTTLLVINELG